MYGGAWRATVHGVAKSQTWLSMYVAEIISQFVAIYIVKGFGIVNKADFFLEFSGFFYNLTDVDNLLPGASAFSESSLNILKFTVHMLLQPGLENFEHYFASVLDKWIRAAVWKFFGIAFLWD